METAGMAREDQKMRSEQVRQAILDTALKMGMGEGFDELSIRKIIKEMNYSTGIIITTLRISRKSSMPLKKKRRNG